MHNRTWNRAQCSIPDPKETYLGLLRVAVESSGSKDKAKLIGYLRSRNIRGLIDWAAGVNPQLYDSPRTYFEDASIAGLVKKVPFPPGVFDTGLTPRETAVEKFRNAEQRCKSFNSNYWKLRSDPVTLHARRFIKDVIGESPDVVDILKDALVPGGACIGVHGNKTNHARKLLAQNWSCTPRARTYGYVMCGLNDKIVNILTGSFMPSVGEFATCYASRVSIQRSNRVSFVPKTAKTMRSIAVEPFVNSMLQGSVDRFLRGRLSSRAHLNLRDQSRNQQMAREGSLGGDNPYATIDLEAASDTLSIGLVKLLLPTAWYAFLADLRSDSYELDGETRVYHKFCSMGNGFCFPLETLIFASLVYGTTMVHRHGQSLPLRSCASRETPVACTNSISSRVSDYSVYGDDIVVRQDVAFPLRDVLQRFGLIVNSEKSFLEGPFRESCGADWFLGQDVRPVVLTRWATNVTELVALHNSYLRSRICEDWGLMLRQHVRDLFPGFFVRPGREPGDTCLSVPLDAAMVSPLVRWDRSLQQWRWYELAARPVSDVLGEFGEEDLARVLNYSMMAGCKSESPWNLRYTSRRRKAKVSRPFGDRYHGLSFADVYEA